MSDSRVVSLRERAEKIQYNYGDLIDQIDTIRSNNISQLDLHQKYSPINKSKLSQGLNDTQEALERISQVLNNKSKSFFKFESLRETTNTQEKHNAEKLDQNYTLNANLSIKNNDIVQQDPPKIVAVMTNSDTSKPEVDVKPAIVKDFKKSSENFETVSNLKIKPKTLSEALPDLAAHRKHMQAHLRTKFAKLKNFYKSNFCSDQPKSSKASILKESKTDSRITKAPKIINIF